MQTENPLQMTVYAALMAALIAAGAFLSIPIGPVPIVLQNFFVLLAGLLLGPRWGTAAVGVYLLAGACGLPIFAGGLGGLGRIFGPTGGYLVGYLPATVVVGIVSRAFGKRTAGDLAALIAGSSIVYACGVPWLKLMTGLTWSKALAAGMLPFLVGDALKVAAAVPVARSLRPVLERRAASPRKGPEAS
jgi:biotin transport system substrate-specific component